MKTPSIKKPKLLLFLCAFACLASAAPESGKIQKLVLEEQKIEGKIRRPQLVLIKADQRPAFAPMASQSFGNNADIIGFVDKKVLDYLPYEGPFLFVNKVIANYQP